MNISPPFNLALKVMLREMEAQYIFAESQIERVRMVREHCKFKNADCKCERRFLQIKTILARDIEIIKRWELGEFKHE